MNNLGEHGEIIASKFLHLNKFIILAKNYVCPIGEIDIIAQKEQVIHFVEVKTRSNLNFGSPAMAVNKPKQNKIKAVASYYLMTHRNLLDARCDIVEVVYSDYLKRYRVNLIENAF